MPDMVEIERPDLGEIDTQKLIPLFDDPAVTAAIERSMSPSYLPWADVRHRPVPSAITREELWYLIKLTRRVRQKETFILDESGKYFTWSKIDRYDRFLHEIDMRAGGNLLVGEDRMTEIQKNNDSYVTRGIIEEAIASSQLEGAHTTRKAAKMMIKQGRKPKTKDEQMIMNNYQAIQKIKDTYRDEKMSVELMLALQRLLTENTEVDAADVGRFRTDGDGIIVTDDYSIGHIPPKEAFVAKEVKRFIQIANDEADEAAFVHPIIKAVFLHFWVGYLHPFADGNGRFARAVFYWYLLRHGYWAMMYLPISEMIKKSPVKYKNAYIYSEQDDLDLNYFVDYHIEVIQLAIRDFNKYIDEKYVENKRVSEKLGKNVSLNERQKSLLLFLSKHPDEQVTIKNYRTHNGVSLLTARHDLYDLHANGFLELSKMSDHFVYFTASKKTIDLGV